MKLILYDCKFIFIYLPCPLAFFWRESKIFNVIKGVSEIAKAKINYI